MNWLSVGASFQKTEKASPEEEDRRKRDKKQKKKHKKDKKREKALRQIVIQESALNRKHGLVLAFGSHQ